MNKVISFLKRLGIRLVVVLVIALTITILIGYLLNYSKGERSGKIVKISQRGVLVKTWECEMNMQAIGMEGAPTQWEFSVPISRRDLLDDIRTAMKDDAIVQVHYNEKFIRIFWEGDTKYWLTKVEAHPDQNK